MTTRFHKPTAAHSFTLFHSHRRGGIRFIQFGRYTLTISKSRKVSESESDSWRKWEGHLSGLHRPESRPTREVEETAWTLVYLVAWPMAALAAIVLTRPLALTLADWLAATLIN